MIRENSFFFDVTNVFMVIIYYNLLNLLIYYNLLNRRILLNSYFSRQTLPMNYHLI